MGASLVGMLPCEGFGVCGYLSAEGLQIHQSWYLRVSELEITLHMILKSWSMQSRFGAKTHK